MCDFQIPFTSSTESLVEKANKAITGIGGTFSGDTGSGQFSLSTPVGKISGTYTVGDKVLHVTIDDKPFFIPCSQIESQLKKSLEGA